MQITPHKLSVCRKAKGMEQEACLYADWDKTETVYFNPNDDISLRCTILKLVD